MLRQEEKSLRFALLVSFTVTEDRWSYTQHIFLLLKIIANRVKRWVPPQTSLNTVILILNALYSTGNYIIGEITEDHFKLSTMTSHCCHGSLCMWVWRWVKVFLMHLHKVCQCIFVSLCSFPTELLNYQSLLFLCVCARVCVGINVYIFVDVIMILCMHIFFSAAIQWIIVSLHDPQSLNVGLETFMYACTEHACIPPF